MYMSKQKWVPECDGLRTVMKLLRPMDHMVMIYLMIGGTAELFSRVHTAIYIPTGNAQGFQFLHFFKNIYMAMLVGMKWYLIIFICISLKIICLVSLPVIIHLCTFMG